MVDGYNPDAAAMKRIEIGALHVVGVIELPATTMEKIEIAALHLVDAALAATGRYIYYWPKNTCIAKSQTPSRLDPNSKPPSAKCTLEEKQNG
jgi:hypothetical protein